jgi:serine/threonine protein kinase
MESERWQQIESLFYAALACPPPEHQRLLNQTCSADAALRQEVESLIAAHDQAGSMISSPALELAAPIITEAASATLAQTTLGPYRVLSRLGSGGMGDVYLAYDTRLGRKIALKTLPDSFTKDHQRVLRFQQEARTASALNHPNIITVYEVGQAQGVQVIATELVEGETLRRALSSGGIRLARALDVALQVAGALAAAHEAGIVHRDIKPENIMLRPDGVVKVLDFGLAKLTETQATSVYIEAPAIANIDTDPGTVIGTAHYMSPEQARGRQVDARTDIFSMGVILYEMTAGRMPFEGKTAADAIASILEKEPLPIATYSPDAPAELQWIVSKALRKDRDERYQTIKELASDLRKVSDDLRLHGSLRPQEPKARLIGSRPRLQRLAAPGVLAILAAGGLIIAAYRLRSGDRQPVDPIKSVAVLPFNSLIVAADDEYLGLGMADDLITRLTNIRQIVVRPTSAVRKYSGPNQDAGAAGRGALRWPMPARPTPIAQWHS